MEYEEQPISQTPFKDRALSEMPLPKDQALKRMRVMYGLDPSSGKNQQLDAFLAPGVTADLNSEGMEPSCVYYAKYACIAGRRMGLETKIVFATFASTNDEPDSSGHAYVYVQGEEDRTVYNLRSISETITYNQLRESDHELEDITEEILNASDETL